MSLNPFTWVRQAVKAAFVGGIADGLAEVSQGMENPPTNLAGLLEQLALPAFASVPAIADKAEATTEELTSPARRKSSK